MLTGQKINTRVLKIMKPKHLEQILKEMLVGEQVLFEHYYESWKSSEFIANQSAENNRNSTPNNIDGTKNLPHDLIDKIRFILKNSTESIQILDYYEMYKHLNDSQKDLLTKAIADYIVANDNVLTIDEIYEIQKDYIQLFPAEMVS